MDPSQGVYSLCRIFRQITLYAANSQDNNLFSIIHSSKSRYNSLLIPLKSFTWWSLWTLLATSKVMWGKLPYAIYPSRGNKIQQYFSFRIKFAQHRLLDEWSLVNCQVQTSFSASVPHSTRQLLLFEHKVNFSEKYHSILVLWKVPKEERSPGRLSMAIPSTIA